MHTKLLNSTTNQPQAMSVQIATAEAARSPAGSAQPSRQGCWSDPTGVGLPLPPAGFRVSWCQVSGIP